ncbi:MAG: hypothetical protein ACRCTR_03830 [Actinomycetota bacterium]
MKILFTLVRRSRSWWSSPFLLGLSLYSLSLDGLSWRGELAWAIEATGVILVLMLPVIAAGAAWEGVTWGRLESLAIAGRRIPSRFYWLIGATAPGLAVYCLLLVVTVILSITQGQVGVVPWLSPVAKVMAIACATAFGLTVGWYLRSVAAIPLSFVVVIFATYADYANVLPLGLMSDGAVGTFVGYRLDVPHALWRIVFCAAVIFVCLVLMKAFVKERGRRWLVGLGLVALTISCSGLSQYRMGYVAARPPVATLCTNSTPQVCVLPEWSRYLGEADRRVQLTVGVLRDLGVRDFPDKYVVEPNLTGEPKATIEIIRRGRASGLIAPQETVYRIGAPGSCGFWSDPAGPPPDRVNFALAALAAYVITQEPRLGQWSNEGISPDYLVFLALPVEKQRAWAAKAAQALSVCDMKAVPPIPLKTVISP